MCEIAFAVLPSAVTEWGTQVSDEPGPSLALNSSHVLVA